MLGDESGHGAGQATPPSPQSKGRLVLGGLLCLFRYFFLGGGAGLGEKGTVDFKLFPKLYMRPKPRFKESAWQIALTDWS